MAIISQNIIAQTNVQQSSVSNKNNILSPRDSSRITDLNKKIKTENGSFFLNLENKKITYNSLKEKLITLLDFNDKHEFKEIVENNDENKKILQHYYKEIKVSESIIIVHTESNYVKTINGRITEFSDIKTTLDINEDQAFEKAKEYLNVTELIQSYPIETVIATVSNNETRKIKTVQKVRIDSYSPFEMCNVLVDATTGEIFNKINLVAHADVPGTGQTLYSGSQSITCDSYEGNYRLRETGRNIQTYNATNATNLTSGGFTGATDYINSSTTWSSNPAIDVHWGMEVTYDFYLNEIGRDSYDNNGGLIRQYLNSPLTQANQGGDPNNAFALEAPYNMMVYGLGDGQFMNPVVGLDVEGHEFTHLVINNNGNGGLTYQGESGALNESFADIFGICVEFYSGVDPDWLIGENIIISGSFFRSMSDPNGGEQPDTYNGNYWVDPNDLFFDNGGVHINSGVQNYWFYLLAEGGVGTNDLGDSYSVSGVGLANARDIAYHSLTNYLPPNASFFDAYYGSLQAAEDLFGNSSAEYIAVEEAWYAVGIGSDEEPSNYCDGITQLSEPSGTFTDGSGSSNYQDNSNCSWVINPPDATQITLTFTSFDTEEDYDKVFVYDGPDDSYPLLATWWGNTLPSEISTTEGTGAMTVKFISDFSVTESGWSANYSSTTLGLNKSILSDQLRIFPNPTNGLFTIESNLNENIDLEILNLLGRQVHKADSMSQGLNRVDVSNLDSGVYMLKFKVNKQQLVKRLIID
ncbi:M4 family metallopeptidase [Mesonia aquimarina]|uniref:M4 family metallopeptidase n=1 Tax=Mesonia aquimarina TaxID=1504967 RepID=UPI0013CF2ED5|nr:M4 family metallopeptidase [Mesonia aquimarina]